MPIVRVNKHTERYVVIDKTGLEDENLSFKAKGLLSYLLSRPDDWKVIREQLAKVSKDGISSVRSGLKELRDAGYLKKQPVRNDSGQIKEWESVIYEIPRNSQKAENPPCGESTSRKKQDVENRNLLSNDSSLSNDNTKRTLGKLWEKIWNRSINHNQLQKLQTYLDELEIEAIEAAMKDSASKDNPASYCKSILNRLVNQDITTISEYEEDKQQFEDRKKSYSDPKSKEADSSWGRKL